MAVETIGTTKKTEKIAYSRLWWVALVTAAGVAIVNAILFYIALALGWMPQSVITPMGTPVDVVPVITTSFIGVLAGAIGLAILNLFLRRPLFVFNILAIIVFVLMIYNPFTLPKAPITMILTLELMHVVVVGAMIVLFNRLTPQAQA